MTRLSSAVVLALGVGLASPFVARAQVVVVPAFTVGEPTFASHLQDVDVVAMPDGTFAVVWGDYQLNNLSGSGDHATFRRFSATGVPLGPPNRIDTSAHVFDPRLSLDGQGGLAASWLWIGTNQYRFFGQTLDAQGFPRGADFEITIDVGGPSQHGPVVGTANGPVFVWDERGMWARRLDAGRERRGGDVRVSDNMYKADVDSLPDGGFVVSWTEFSVDIPSLGRIFGPTGQPRGPSFPISDVLHLPRVAASPRGGIASAGIGADPATNDAQVLLRRFADDGTPLGTEILVEQEAPGTGVDPDLAFDDRGNVFVAWARYSGTTQLAPRGRAYDADGNPLGPAIDLGPGGSAEIRVARLADGSLVNVWYWNALARGSVVDICVAGTSVCGDGVRAPACEECDAGGANGNAPDACRSDCRRARCGDGVVDAGETCDDGNATACDGCSPRCAVEPGHVCGDGVLNQACGEECDAGGANGTSPGGCRTTCAQAHCGDGVVDGGEACDDGNTAACDGCGPDCAVEIVAPAVCGPRTLAGASAAAIARFSDGRDEFLSTENVATGLGPVFNGRSCAECHSFPTVGGSSDRSVTLIGAASGSIFDPLPAHGGLLLQAEGISTGTCSVPGETVPPEANVVARRNTPALFGAGLIEAIPEIDIRKMRSRQKSPISGAVNTHRATGLVGRFGWKAQIPNLQDFAAEAYRDEMGISSPFAPDEPAPQGVPATCDGVPGVDDDGDDVAAFVDFLTLLAPIDKPAPTREARLGRGYFRRARCHLCHVDKYRTGTTHPIPALRRVRVPLFSDLLLHDMGPGLADGVRQEGASGSEFRTAPLWGARFTAPYLHDGRAATLEEAILAHGGESLDSRNRFISLTAAQRAAVIAYIGSL